MLKKMGFKAALPALFSGGRRGLSTVTTNFPFANGGKGLKRRCSSEVNSPITFNADPWDLHTEVASPKQSLALPRHDVDVVENSKDSHPSTVADDDDFAELGPSMSGGVGSGIDLVKEKPKDEGLPGKLLGDRSQQATKSSQRQDSFAKFSFNGPSLKQDKFRPGTHFNLEGQNGALKSKTEVRQENYQNSKSLFISIDKIPPNIALLDLEQSVSAYGEILSFSMRPAGQNGLSSCHVKFKSLESKERAVEAKWISVKNLQLPVRSLLYSLEFVTVRITNVGTDTAESGIHSLCTSFGVVTGLSRTRDGAVEVVFRVKDISVSQSIVEHLNDVYVDGCRWSAQLLPKPDLRSTINAFDSQGHVGSQVSSLLDNFRKQHNMQRIYLEDLEDLHNAVLHLRDQPPNLPNSSFIASSSHAQHDAEIRL